MIFIFSENFRCESAFIIRYEEMTSFGYEIMLPRGFWFQTLDVNKTMVSNTGGPLAFFFWCSHIFLSDYPKAIRRGEISFKSNHVIERNFEAANSRITGTSSGQL